MTHSPDALKSRTKRFALEVLALSRELNSHPLDLIARQLTRSATAVGANYRSACRSRSRAEFVSRIGVVLEEADESAFWLELLLEQPDAENRNRLATLLDEANQLTAILAASRITASQAMD